MFIYTVNADFNLKQIRPNYDFYAPDLSIPFHHPGKSTFVRPVRESNPPHQLEGLRISPEIQQDKNFQIVKERNYLFQLTIGQLYVLFHLLSTS